MKKTKRHRVALTFLSVLLPIGSADAALICSGTISRLAMHPSGTVQVNYGYGVHYICSFEQSYGGFAPATCKALYATMLSAQLAGKPISIYFENGSYNTCSELPSWSALSPAPYHIALLEGG